jgi:hypothetical protein
MVCARSPAGRAAGDGLAAAAAWENGTATFLAGGFDRRVASRARCHYQI